MKIKKKIVTFKTILSRRLKYLQISPANCWRMLRLIHGMSKAPRLLQTLTERIKVACILDEFSYACFSPEANFLQITPDAWEKEIEAFAPDMFFVESAWRGADGKWQKKISEISNELIEVIYWCRMQNIPTVFWHKEVPPHFSTFLYVSKMFDLIFLSDADCIPAYRKKLGHERVFYLPFACQPKIHHPIIESERKNAIMYAGTYYPDYKYPERCRDFNTLFTAIEPRVPIDIFDRSGGKGNYIFPDRFKKYIKGSLPFSEVSKTYRSYRYGLNMNSVKDSESMCARRVFELIASNTFVIGNFSKAVKNYFGDLTLSSDDANEIIVEFDHLKRDETRYEKKKLTALRKVFSEHTYERRFDTVLKTICPQLRPPEGCHICILAFSRTISESNEILKNFTQQSHIKKHLYLVSALTPDLTNPSVTVLNSLEDLDDRTLSKNYDYFGIFDAGSFYGKNYLTDLSLAFLYSSADVITKASYFSLSNSGLSVQNPGIEYKMTHDAVISRSLVKSPIISQVLPLTPTAKITGHTVVSIDKYNYCHIDEGKMTEGDISAVSDL